MALKEELTLDTSKAQSSVKAIGAQLDQVTKNFSKSLAEGIKIPKIEVPPLDVPTVKVPRPVIPAPDGAAFEAKVKELTDKVKESANAFKTHFADATAAVGQTVGALGAAFVGVGAASTNVFADFELSLSRIKGLVGLSDVQIKGFSDDILALSGKVAKSPKELADALYFVTSSGIDAADAMDIVTVAAKAAAAGLGDTQTVADAVTSATNAYGIANLSAAKATDILVKTVKDGKGEPAELAQAIGQVIPIASNLGVSFDQVGAGLAALSLTGLDASEAATALRQVLATLLNPTKEARDTLAGLGLSAEGLRKELREKGLNATLADLAEKTKGNEEATALLFGNIRALTGVLSLTGANAGRTAQIFADLANSTGATDEAFAAFKETTQFTFDAFKAGIRTSAIALGAQFAPAFKAAAVVATSSLRDITNGIKGISLGFDERDVTQKLEHLQTALKGLEPAIAGVGLALVGAFGGGLPVIGQYLGAINPVVAILGGLLASTAPGRAAFVQLADIMRNTAEKVGPPLLATFREVSAILGTTFASVVQSLGPPVGQLVVALSKLATEALPPIAQLAGDTAVIIGKVLGPAISGVAAVVGLLADHINVTLPIIAGLAAGFLALKIAAGVKAGIEGLTLAIQFLKVGMETGNAGVLSLIGSLGVMGPIFVGVAAVVGIATVAFLKHRQEQEAQQKAVDALVVAYKDETKGLHEITLETLQATLNKKKLNDVSTGAGITEKEYAAAILGSSDALGDVNQKLKIYLNQQLAAGKAPLEALGNVQKLSDALRLQATEQNKAAQVTLQGMVASHQLTQARLEQILAEEHASGSTQTYSSALDRVKSATNTARTAAEEYKTALDKAFGKKLSAEEAALRYEQSINAVTAALQQNGREFDKNGNLVLANREAILASTQSAKDRADVINEDGKHQAEANQSLKEYTDTLRAAIDPTGANKAATDKYLASLGLLDPALDTTKTKLHEYIDTLALTPGEKKTVLSLDNKQAYDDLIVYLKKLGLSREQIVTFLTLEGVPDAEKFLDGFKARKEEATKTATAKINADTTEAHDKMLLVQDEKNKTASPVSIPVGANTVPATNALTSTVAVINAATGRLTIDANTAPADAKFKALLTNVNKAIASFVIGGKAIGGPVAAATPYVVGEKGPELFVPDVPGQIVPHNKLTSVVTTTSKAAQPISGGTTLTIAPGAVQMTFSGAVTSEAAARAGRAAASALMDEFYNQVRSNA